MRTPVQSATGRRRLGQSLLLAVAAVVLVSACATPKYLPTIAGPICRTSEKYLVCRLREATSPADLAEKLLGDRGKAWVVEDANEGLSFARGEIVVIPLSPENRGGITASGYQVVPILCYHRFESGCTSPMCITPTDFERQMQYLKESAYRVISFRELMEFVEYRRALPKRSVVITIDDGYRSAYEQAYPILKKYGFSATLFIYTEFVGVSRQAITWDQLREMKANGFEIGSHSVRHSDLTEPEEQEDQREYLERVKREIRLSKEIIDRELEQDTLVFAFPYGRHDKRAVALVREAGYQLAVTVERGFNAFFAQPLVLKRNMVLTQDMRDFRSWVRTLDRF